VKVTFTLLDDKETRDKVYDVGPLKRRFAIAAAIQRLRNDATLNRYTVIGVRTSKKE
jgi:hypothetical protein